MSVNHLGRRDFLARSAAGAAGGLLLVVCGGAAAQGVAPRPPVAFYDFEHPASGDLAVEQDQGASGTPFHLVNGGAAMRVRDGAHAGSTWSIRTRQVNPAANGNDDWKGGIFSETGVTSLSAFAQARGITIMGWVKRTGTDQPAPNSNTADPADRYNAVGLLGILSGTSTGHAVRALLEGIRVADTLRLVALGRRIDEGSSRVFAARERWEELLPLDEWVFLAATFDFDNGTMALYRNGLPLDGFYTSAGDPWGVAGPPEPDLTSPAVPRGIKVGGSFPQNSEERNPFDGRFDDLAFLDSVLIAGQVLSYYQGFRRRPGNRESGERLEEPEDSNRSAAGHHESVPARPVSAKPHRLLVLTDIEADPDDRQSLIRLLLYTNEIDVEGLVATTSVHQKTRVAPESIERVIRAYGEVQPNLSRHASGFPSEEELLGLVKQGRAEYGMQGVGEGKDSEGSDWIIEVLEDDDERPLWISVWGGPNTLAQALYRIRETKSEQEAARLISKLRVYTISDQDDSAIWIRRNFPVLFYIVSPGGYDTATWIAINRFVPGIDNETISNSWLAENIQQGHGPLGALYPDVAWGMEGDTPAWLSLVPNGLNVPEHPDWGGWGGRYELYQPEYASLNTEGFTGGVPVESEPRPIWTNAVDHYVPYVHREYGRAVQPDTVSFTSNKATLWRWRDAFQNDFAARMDWTILSHEEANHPPAPPPGEEITVESGEAFTLNASGTTDPDGDALSYLWFHYPEAGSYTEPIELLAENLSSLSVTAPEVEKPETAHFILSVTDKGTPALTRYRRVIVNILP